MTDAVFGLIAGFALAETAASKEASSVPNARGVMRRIEDYAFVGDCQTAALVSLEGSIDWLCFPRFDSAACFAALLGTPDNGRWLLSPAGSVRAVRRRYRGDTLVLETEFETDEGTAAVIDFMPIRDTTPDLVRIVEGRRGRVPMKMELVIRFDYGHVIPWVQRTSHGISAIAGPDMLGVRTDVPMHGRGLTTVAEFDVSEGQRVSFDLTWYPSHAPEPCELDTGRALKETELWWEQWVAKCQYVGDWRSAVVRSLITLRGLIYTPTGGIVAAPTTSLPELFGGVRNWDYRFCWLRDATFTLLALMQAGYLEEASAWREWLLRAIAGSPDQVQIMYGIAGERRLPEYELGWLSGFSGSLPVRIGNAAHGQFQLDVFGEVMDAMNEAWRVGIPPSPQAWNVERALVQFVETAWCRPDEGIWEVRGPRRHFTHSKMMAWVALDRAVKGIEQHHLPGPLDRWRAARARIHEEVCEKGYNPSTGTFTQFYGSDRLDASLLMMPLVGFLPASDERVRRTIEAVQRNLSKNGFVARYETDPELDGLPHGEGRFLLCSFWLADCLELLGRHEEACRLFEQLLAIRNDVGLLAEGYDDEHGRLTGNFPQAFSHIGLVNTATTLSYREPHSAARERGLE
ncbi:MAG TPA: glycoside hydrolase family 15 protein [Terriglobales bacterium]|nr:glycoside hydrolase family 15 protein [Terriglobales bacterium]